MDRLLSHDCHCLLADEMGLGKTLQVIALMQDALSRGSQGFDSLSGECSPVWISEFEKIRSRP